MEGKVENGHVRAVVEDIEAQQSLKHAVSMGDLNRSGMRITFEVGTGYAALDCATDRILRQLLRKHALPSATYENCYCVYESPISSGPFGPAKSTTFLFAGC